MMPFTSPFGKGGERGILRTPKAFGASIYILLNLPLPLLAKEEYSLRRMTEDRVLKKISLLKRNCSSKRKKHREYSFIILAT
jgi:hypothetical protein